LTVSGFRTAITAAAKSRKILVTEWAGAKRTSVHLLELRTSPKRTVIYVKESSSSPGFWGLTKNQLDRLRKSGDRWFCVLLTGGQAGYILSGGQVDLRVQDGRFELSRDGDHKVNESDLAEAQIFTSVQGALDRLV
jgi:hypothetical protein